MNERCVCGVLGQCWFFLYASDISFLSFLLVFHSLQQLITMKLQHNSLLFISRPHIAIDEADNKCLVHSP